MREFVFGLAVVAACGSVSEKPDAKPTQDSSSEPDAPAGGVAIGAIDPVAVHINAMTAVNITLVGKPNEAIKYAFTAAAAGGSFGPSTGDVTLDGTGHGKVTTTYSAPSVNGTFAHNIAVTSSANVVTMRSFDSTVAATEVSIGHATQFTSTNTYTKDFLLGIKVDVPSLATLARIGVIGQSTGSNVKMALYSDGSGKPATLIAQFTPKALPNGRLEVPVTNVTLQPGAYWIMADYDVTATIGRAATAEPIGYITHPYANALPATIANATIDPDQGGPNYYIVVLQ